MNEYRCVLINLDEIWLKGGNRKWYLEKLQAQISHQLRFYHPEKFKLHRDGPKFYMLSDKPVVEETLQALSRVSGIKSIQPCLVVETDLEKIKETALQEINQEIDNLKPEAGAPITFRVETKRSNKKFPFTSMEISRQVGGYLLHHRSGLKANMNSPQINVAIRVLGEETFIATRKIPGMSGVPIPTSGKAITLLSGGFDSPVAAYMMFRRGLEQTMTFFHAYPYVGHEAAEKVKRLCAQLAKYQRVTKLYVLPFGDIQKKIGEECRTEYRTLLFRQYMVRVAERVARIENAKALIMGDSLAQVSSQTLDNMSIADQTASIPTLRPLVGFNKCDIIDLAKRAGTHDISAEAQDDACALFAPKHPIIRGSKAYTDEFYADFPLTEELSKCVKEAEVLRFNVRGEEIKKSQPKEQLFDFSDV